MKGRTLGIMSLLLLAILVAACAPAAAPTPVPAPKPTAPPAAVATPTPAQAPAPAVEKPRYGGILNVQAKADLNNYDLHQTVYAADLHPLEPMFNLLIKTDPKDISQVIPDLAEKWEVSPDGKVYTFQLRQGVKWHDGQPFSSADVKASFDRISNPPKGIFSPRQSYYRLIEKVEAPDANTVRFTLKNPQAAFLLMVAVPFSVIFPKHILDKKGDMKKDVVGTGAFVFKEHMRGSHMFAEKNPAYFKAGLPYLDGIMRYIISDDGAVEAALRTGRIDLTLPWNYRPPPNIRQKLIQSVPGMTEQLAPGHALRGLIFNVKKAPWSDVRVRRAALLAMDKADLGKVLTRGDEIMSGFMPRGPWAFPKDELLKQPGFRKPTPEDMAEAKRLMAEAGYPDGFKATIMVRAVKMYEDEAVAVKHELTKIGIDVNLDIVESAAFLRRRELKDFAFMSYGVVSVEMGDPDMVLSKYFGTSPGNYTNYSNAKFDELYDKQSQALDPAERKKLVFEMQKILYEDIPAVPYWWYYDPSMIAPRVKNYLHTEGLYTNFDLADVWLTR
ncbi:MAG: ABC transporter substrate-binding protein [Chloroflexota bacterium]|nr:ABC transporter substrate-binding protein [Chloroflexota bacterium]